MRETDRVVVHVCEREVTKGRRRQTCTHANKRQRDRSSVRACESASEKDRERLREREREYVCEIFYAQDTIIRIYQLKIEISQTQSAENHKSQLTNKKAQLTTEHH